MTEHDRGYQAFYEGLTEDDNPHKYGSEDWNQWLTGFQLAESEE